MMTLSSVGDELERQVDLDQAAFAWGAAGRGWIFCTWPGAGGDPRLMRVKPCCKLAG